MSSEPPRVGGALVRRVGTVLVAMMLAAIAATAVGLLIDGEALRGLGIFVMLGTPFAALARVAVHGASRREPRLVVFPLATLAVVVLGIVLAR